MKLTECRVASDVFDTRGSDFMDSIEECQPGPYQGTQSIQRALAVLRIVAMGPKGGVFVSDVTEKARLTRPTAYRILSLLAAEGMVEYNQRSKRYVIGEQVTYLALARSPRFALLEESEPYLCEAAKLIGDTVFLTIRAQLDTLCLARRLGNYPVQVLSLDVGERRPLGVSSAGLAILGTLPESEAHEVILENQYLLPSYGTTVRRAAAEAKNARTLGYALRPHGLVPGTRSLSVAIDGGSNPVAALTITAAAHRLHKDRVKGVVDFLKESAAAIGAALQR